MADSLGLTEFRESIAKLLAANLDDDIGVFSTIPDSIAPPSVYVSWGNPWLLPGTFCVYTTAAQLILVSQRIEPGGHYGVLEDMLSQVVGILQENHVTIRDASSPYPIVLAGVNYLAASINIVQDIGD